MKLAKKQRKEIKRLDAQKRSAYRVEDAILKATAEGAKPAICPVHHHFSEGIYCRELFVEKGVTLTGVIHKIDSFFVLVKGSMRLLWGNTTVDVIAPALCKNVPGVKNSAYMMEDCLLYGFTPNPDNLRDIEAVINIYSKTPANEVQGMGNNTQEKIYQARLEHVA